MAIALFREYGPKTKTRTETAIDAVEIDIDNAEGIGLNAFLDPAGGDRPGSVTMSQDEDYNSEDPATYETFEYTGVDDTPAAEKLTGVTHVGGTKQVWPAGTVIASKLSAVQLESIVAAITDIGVKTLDNQLVREVV